MAYYMWQVAYTPEAWAAQVANPQDRREAVRPVVESYGGRLVDAWYAFGDYDVVAVFEMPDGVGTAALSMALAAGGAAKDVKTTPLLTMEEGLEAMRRANRRQAETGPDDWWPGFDEASWSLA